jgi:hypothetical protein
MLWGMSADTPKASGTCKLYCRFYLLPRDAFDPPACSSRICTYGEDLSPCAECAAAAPATFTMNGHCILESLLSQLTTQASLLQAVDLHSLSPPLGTP